MLSMSRRAASTARDATTSAASAAAATTRVQDTVDRIRELIHSSRRVTVLTGAGMSTDSGIPDYRSPGRPPYRPLQHHEFIKSEFTRKRYWARSVIGYPRLAKAQPNEAHKALAQFEQTGKVAHLITQNVDELHQRAGSRHVLNLHGTIHQVVCLKCGRTTCRREYQEALLRHNPHMRSFSPDDLNESRIRPDGDVELNDSVYRSFNLVHCAHDSGWIKPDVVFFGDNIQQHVVSASYDAVDDADMLLVAGTSLQVWSALRLVKRALDCRKPVAVVTRGPTRADDIVTVKGEGALSELLPAVLK